MLGKNYFEGSAENNEAKNLRKHYFEKETELRFLMEQHDHFSTGLFS
jgi:hypothetical protein